jgi:DNA integrity scanning protein DisA with diadenylate cyclase activity
MMLAAFEGGQPQVTTGLTRFLISESRKRPDEIVSQRVSRQLHTAITSSRTQMKANDLGARVIVEMAEHRVPCHFV